MGRMGKESDSKTKLVLEICSISTRSVLCVHHTLLSKPFIDWYCILGVEENAGVNAIRKRYHKLALQVHPDKNKHPNAEIAFKLVSEAYACLSNAAKRKAFDLERCKHFCFECKRIPYTSSNVPGNSSGSVFKAWNMITRSRSFKLWRNIRDMRERFMDEAKVIENCLRTNSMSRKESPPYDSAGFLHRSKSMHRFEKETPVFNPSDYLHQGYPHLRSNIYKNSSTFWYLQRNSMRNSMLHNEKGGALHASPVFDVKSRNLFASKFTFVPSKC